MMHRDAPYNDHSQRSGMGLLGFLISVVVLALLAYVGWVTYSSWARTGKVDALAVLDAEQRSGAHDDARPHIDYARELGSDALARLRQLSEQTFGDGGYIDQASSWMSSARSGSSPIREALDEEESAAPQPPPAPAEGDDAPAAPAPPPPAPSKSAETQRLEAAILKAEEQFQAALKHYEAANPAAGGWTPERRRAVDQARRGFNTVRETLSTPNGNYDLVERYAAQGDHSPGVRRQAEQLIRHNQRLLANARRMSSAF